MSNTVLAAQASRLPMPLTPLIGRTREVAAIGELLRRFVPLAPVRDPLAVLPAIARVLGVRDGGDRSLADLVALALHEADLLLVLDNVEQVLAAAPIVGALLSVCPRVSVLATSRERLRLGGEQEFPVRPLPLPSPAQPGGAAALEGNAAVRLFTERSRAIDPAFALNDANAGAVAEICRRLDGLPLAIELAAARSKVLPPAALLKRLERRLPLLIGGSRDVPARQQTLRDTIAWSYDLLAEDEQALFRRLAVFVGGFTLDGAEAVWAEGGGRVAGDPIACDIVLDGVSSLVERNLLVRLVGAESDPRFGILETVREFALERLAASGEADAVRRSHAEYALALAERLGAGLTGPDQGHLLRELERDHDNFREALAGPIERGGLLGLRLAKALAWFWRLHGHLTEGRAWMERALAAAGDVDPALRADALDMLGMFASDIGDSTLALHYLEESVAHLVRGWGTYPGNTYGRPVNNSVAKCRLVTVDTTDHSDLRSDS